MSHSTTLPLLAAEAAAESVSTWTWTSSPHSSSALTSTTTAPPTPECCATCSTTDVSAAPCGTLEGVTTPTPRVTTPWVALIATTPASTSGGGEGGGNADGGGEGVVNAP